MPKAGYSSITVRDELKPLVILYYKKLVFKEHQKKAAEIMGQIQDIELRNDRD